MHMPTDVSRWFLHKHVNKDVNDCIRVLGTVTYISLSGHTPELCYHALF